MCGQPCTYHVRFRRPDRFRQSGRREETDTKKTEKWVQLFNGKNLDGWTPKIRYHEAGENFKDTFRVEDGVLKVGYEKYDEFNETFGHLFYKDNFSNYRLRVEYRFVGEQCKGGPGWAYRNSGIMIHGERPETMAKDQDFPASIEVQLLGGDGIRKIAPTRTCVHPGQMLSKTENFFCLTAPVPHRKPITVINGSRSKWKSTETA